MKVLALFNEKCVTLIIALISILLFMLTYFLFVILVCSMLLLSSAINRLAK